MDHGARPLRSTRRLANLTGSRPGWYKITNVANAPTQVTIFDEVGFFGVSAAEFLNDLRQITGDIELHLNSPGGDVFDGIAIYNTLRQAQNRGKVRVIVDGLAASAASFIAQAASPGMLEMAPHSQMMIHDGFAMGIGNAGDMRSLADHLDQASDNIASIYADRTGKPAAYWRDKMKAETWYTDAEAVADGLADNIHGQETPGNNWDLSVFAKYVPGETTPVAAVTGAGADHAHEVTAKAAGPCCPACGPECKCAEGVAARATSPVNATGMHGDHERIDPDNDGDCDACPEGDTDHDYWSEDGKQLQPLPGKPMPGNRASRFPVLDAAVDNSPWDASKAWHNGAESDDPAAFYRGICAGRKSGDPSTQDAWALPYKYHPSDPPNAAGVRAALARLSSTQGLTNADEARSKLERLMKQINPDYEPDNTIDPDLLAQLFTLGLEGASK